MKEGGVEKEEWGWWEEGGINFRGGYVLRFEWVGRERGKGEEKECEEFAGENGVENGGGIIEIEENGVDEGKVEVGGGDSGIRIEIEV